MILSEVWGELALYQQYAAKEGIPYVDFELEYPPCALGLFKLANIFGEKWFTLMWYGMVAIAILLACLVIKRMKGNLFVFLAAILPLGGLFWDRFDIFPALFSLLAVYFVWKRDLLGADYLWGFFLLGIGVMTKLYPIMLLPVLIGMLIKRGRGKDIWLGIVMFIIPILWCFIFFPYWTDLFNFHKDRGIQIESVRAIPKLLNKDSIVEYSHNTFEIK